LSQGASLKIWNKGGVLSIQGEWSLLLSPLKTPLITERKI